MKAELCHQNDQDADLPEWVKTGATGEPLDVAMRSVLENRANSNGGPLVPQRLHLDLALPRSLALLEEYRSGKTVITAGSDSVFLWIVPNSQKMMEDLAKCHIRYNR